MIYFITQEATNHKQRTETMKTLDLGNNETISRGITKNSDGTFTAMTFTQSKTFKTLKGAEKWIARR